MIGGVTVVAVATRRRRNEDVVVVVVATGNSDVTNGSTRITMAVVQGGRGGERGRESFPIVGETFPRNMAAAREVYFFSFLHISPQSQGTHTHTQTDKGVRGFHASIASHCFSDSY